MTQEHVDCVDCGQCVSADVHGQLIVLRRDSWSTTHRGWTTTEYQLLQCFEFHDKHGRNRRKERICFDHELVRDQNKSNGNYQYILGLRLIVI